MQTLRIVFMGTPDFAVPCLQTLLDSPHSVVGVFTQPDKPQGRKMVLTPPPVKVLAAENGAHSVGHLRRRNRDRRDHYANGCRTGHWRYAAG